MSYVTFGNHPLRHYFGAPAIFFTVTPCDECNFRVRLYATSHEHKLPDVKDIENQKILPT